MHEHELPIARARLGEWDRSLAGDSIGVGAPEAHRAQFDAAMGPAGALGRFEVLEPSCFNAMLVAWFRKGAR